MVLVSADLPSKSVRSMIDEMESVDGVKYVLGIESVVGSRVPEEIIPDGIRSILESDKWELLLINSEYKVASDKVNDQIDSLNAILKKYDAVSYTHLRLQGQPQLSYLCFWFRSCREP